MTPPIVSRETSPRLAAYEDLLRRWSSRINLISRGDLDRIWTRHVSDSAQIFEYAPEDAATWLDLGSGAGLPGLVCAALAAEQRRQTRFTLIESDARKSAFLREAVRQLDLPAEIETRRIETATPRPFDVITSRALAPLPKLLSLAHPFCRPGTVCLFPKGQQAESELTQTLEAWHTTVTQLPSRTEPGAMILKMTDIAPRP